VKDRFVSIYNKLFNMFLSHIGPYWVIVKETHTFYDGRSRMFYPKVNTSEKWSLVWRWIMEKTNVVLLLCFSILICKWLYHSPPVAGVWWAHWRHCTVAAVASSKWMLNTGGGWREIPWYDCKSLCVYGSTWKHYIKCLIHLFIHMAYLNN